MRPRQPAVSLARIRQGINKRGQALVEFMLIIPLILLLISGVADLGRAFYYKIAVENTAREAAHWAILTDPNGNAFDDNGILQKVQTPSQETFGIGVSLAPQCTGSGTYTDAPPVGNCTGGTSVLRYSTPSVGAAAASANGLATGQSWMFIYPGLDGRTALGPAPAKVAWTVSDVRSYTVAGTGTGYRAKGWLDEVGGAFLPAEADASTGDQCYGFGPPTSLTTWNASLDPANSPTLTQTENPTVSITGSKQSAPANDLLISVTSSSPSLSGSLTQSWTPPSSPQPSAYIVLSSGQANATATGTLNLSTSNPPAPGTYHVTVTVTSQNKANDTTVACTQIDQSNTFDLNVYGDPCKSGYTNPPGNPFSTSCSRPVVYSVSPPSGSYLGGYNVTVNGRGFSTVGNSNCAGVDTVHFGSVVGTVVSCNDTTMVATVPAAPPSTVDVTVTNPTKGTSSLNSPADTFTYQCAAGPTGSKPCIQSVIPRNGPKAGGTSVTITGANFFNGGGACAVSAVTFGGPAVTPTSCSDTSLVVTNPASATAPNTVDVRVTTPGGQSDVSTTDSFTYLADPGPPPPPAVGGPKVHQITVTVIYAFVPITPGIGFFDGSTILYIVGEATLKATY